MGNRLIFFMNFLVTAYFLNYIPGFSSYLSERRMSVLVNSYSSYLYPISDGVPQGSDLSPFQFFLTLTIYYRELNHYLELNKNRWIFCVLSTDLELILGITLADLDGFATSGVKTLGLFFTKYLPPNCILYVSQVRLDLEYCLHI